MNLNDCIVLATIASCFIFFIVSFVYIFFKIKSDKKAVPDIDGIKFNRHERAFIVSILKYFSKEKNKNKKVYIIEIETSVHLINLDNVIHYINNYSNIKIWDIIVRELEDLEGMKYLEYEIILD